MNDHPTLPADLGREGEAIQFSDKPGRLVAVADSAGHIVLWNDASEETTGLSPEAVRGKPCWEVLCPQDPAFGQRTVFEAEGARLPHYLEAEYEDRKGRRRRIGWLLRGVKPGAQDVRYLLVAGTELSLAEAPKRRRENDSLLLDSCGLALYATSLEGTIRAWNPAAEHLYGYPAAEMIGRSVSLLMHPDRRSEMICLAERLRRGETIRSLVTERVRKDGVSIQVSLTLAPLRNAAGQVEGGVVVEEDTALWRSAEARFRGLLDAAPDPTVIVDPSGTIIHASAQVESVFGYRKDELEGQAVEMLAPERFRPIYGHTLHKFAAAPQTRALGKGIDLFARRRDGSEFPVEISASSFCTSLAMLVSVAIRDATERRKTVLELRESESRLHQAEVIGRTGSWEWDVLGQKGSLSPGLIRLAGLDPITFDASLEGLLGLVHPDDRDRVRHLMMLTIREGVPFATEFRLVRSDAGLLVILARGEVVQSDLGRPVRIVGTAQDITERKRAEVEISRLNSQLEGRVLERTLQLEGALREMETFTHAVAHDLRAPLRALHGISDLLLEDFSTRSLDDEGRGHLRKIQQSARRMDNLIQDLLAYASLRGEEIPRQPVNVLRLAGEVVACMSDEIERSGGWVVVERSSDRVMANPVLLAQAVTNLVSNALKFVAPGVLPAIRIYAEPRAETVRLAIQDNGIGIASEHFDRIFGMFQRLNKQEDYAGTGIGLALVRRAVERMGGQAGLASELGKGSTFFIDLPKAN